MMSKIFNYLPPKNRADKIVTVTYQKQSEEG